MFVKENSPSVDAPSVSMQFHQIGPVLRIGSRFLEFSERVSMLQEGGPQNLRSDEMIDY